MNAEKKVIDPIYADQLRRLDNFQAAQRKLRAQGRDVEAAQLGEKIQKLQEQAEKIAKERASLALLGLLNGLWSTGIRINGEDFWSRIKTLEDCQKQCAMAGDLLDWCKTPSDRLRYMLLQGRSMEAMATGAADYAEFAELLRAYVAPVQKEGEQDLVDTFGRRLWSCVKWTRCGGNQFEVTPDLAAALLLTTVSEATEDELRLPFDTLAMSLPHGAIPFVVTENGAMRSEWADTLWFERCGADATLVVVRWRVLELHWFIDDKFVVLEADGNDEKFPLNAPDDEVTLQATIRLVRNFALWLGAEGGIKSHKPEIVPKKLAEKRAKSGVAWPRHWLFGKEVKIGPELRRAAAEIVLGRTAKHQVDGWHVRARFTVRGHWRNQAHGEGRALRRRQWIAPFWKGPAEKEAWAHIYKPKEGVK